MNSITRSAALAMALTMGIAATGRADIGECGQPYSDGASAQVTDALYVLQAGVALQTCALCICDLNDSGGVNVLDALIDLKGAVGQVVTFDCPACEPVTTTTLSGCPPAGGLDDLVFHEKYTCIEAFTGESYTCVDQDVSDSIRFTHKGGGQYEVGDEPDTGFVYTGTLSCTTFEWNASSPGNYTETGTWEFNDSLTSFSGDSSYHAVNNSYSGICNETGAKSPATPPNPPDLPPCN